MKLRWYDRILVALSGLVLAAAGVAVVLWGCGAIRLPEPFALDLWTGGDWQWLPVIFLGGALVFAWGLRLLVRPFCFRQDKQSRYFTVKTGETDTLSISVAALDQLVRKCVNACPEVTTSKIVITGQEKAMRVNVRVTLRGGVCIPEVVARLQDQIKQYVTGCSGVPVETVRVIVEAAKDDGEGAESVKLLKPVEQLPSVDRGETEKAAEAEAAAEEAKTPEPETAAEAEEKEEPVQAPVEKEAEEPLPSAEPEKPEEPLNFDFGPEEKLPVELSADAFPFSGEKKDGEKTDA